MLFSRRTFLSLAVLLVAASAPAAAQVGLTTDLITGVVSAEDSTPLNGALVEVVSLETQIARSARTDARGRYTVLFPDGGGQYRVTVRYIGMQPNQATIQRIADEDRLVWNVRLSASAVILEGITVRAPPRAVVMPDLPTPGSIERNYSTEMLARLPIDATDLSLLATLAPGVVPIEGNDSTAAAYSVAGLRPDANGVTMDGLAFGGSVPQEGIRSTRVVTSTYDVARGSFSGGMISSTSRGGSNMMQGSSGYSLRDERLAVESDDSSAYAQGYTQNQLSGGLGGPLVKNRLFLFGSLQGRLRSDAQQTLLSATDPDLGRLGVSPDSVARFLSAVQTVGVSPTAVLPQRDRSTNNYSALGRLDYLVSDSHTLTLRGDWRGTSQDPARLTPLSLPETGGITTSSGGGGLISLTSRFGNHVISDAHAYLSRSIRDSDPYLTIPNGRVQIASLLPDGTRGITTLTFGGSTAGSGHSNSTNLEAAEELSWLPGRGRHRVKLGATMSLARATDIVGGNEFGTFTYNSLSDLELGRPSSFRRTITPAARLSHGLNSGLYAGDVWVPARGFQLTYGARIEESRFFGVPPYNPTLNALFARRTDHLPSEWHASPRTGFTWTIGIPRFAGIVPGAGVNLPEQNRPARRTPALVLRGGVGEFRSTISSGLVASAQSSTGFSSSESQISCIGSGVPSPDWSAYRADTVAIPDNCVSGGPGGITPAPNATVFAPGFEASRAWRASLGAERSLSQLLRLSMDASYSRGVSQYGFRDLNLVTTPRFSLGEEGGRPVFVAPDAIAPLTGAVGLAASRLHPEFGQVLEVGSDLGSRSEQLTTSLSGFTRRGIQVSLSYTLAHARDQSSSGGFGTGGFASATTGGNPNQREWAASTFDRRHAFVTTVTYPFGTSIELTGIGRVTSGAPYTPLVGSDINGDGARNDRAFVFDPTGTTAQAAGIGRLLAAADPRVGECLNEQIGRVAARNSCRGPWQTTFDLQLNLRPSFLGLKRRLMVSIVTVNLLRGVDDLVHGSDNAHGWGLTLRPDATLLYVTGFDSTARRFSYAVNERFGATGSGANPIRSPFQIGIQGRLTLGPDRTRQAIDALRGGGGGGRGGVGGGGGGFGGRVDGGGPGGFGGGPGGPRGGGLANGNFAARFATTLPNPAAQVLAIKDSVGLQLTPAQVTRLEALRDTLAAHIAAIADAIQQAVTKQGAGAQPTELLGVMRPRFEEGRAASAKTLEEVRGVLTPEQWQKVPDPIKAPRGPGGPGGGPGGRGGFRPPR